MIVKPTLQASITLLFLLIAPFAHAKPQLEDRLKRVENIVENEFNIDLVNQIAALQQELQELRGKIEEQQNELQQLSKKQDKIFTNLDSRLSDANTTKTSEPELDGLPDEAPSDSTEQETPVDGQLFEAAPNTQ